MNADENFKFIFPTPLFCDMLHVDDVYRVSLVDEIRKNVDDTKKQHCTTKTSFYKKNACLDNLFLNVLDQINEKVELFCQKLGINFELLERKKFWTSICSKGEYHNWHTHCGNIISGVYYVQVPTDDHLCLDFYNNVQRYYSYLGYIDKHSIFNEIFSERVCTNKIILFLGDTPHGFTPNPSEEDKVTIAFNYSLKK